MNRVNSDINYVGVRQYLNIKVKNYHYDPNSILYKLCDRHARFGELSVVIL